MYAGSIRAPARGRQIIFGLAFLAAGGAAFFAYRLVSLQRSELPEPRTATPATVGVLVARNTMSAGHRVDSSDFTWAQWPQESVSNQLINSGNRAAATHLIGSIARFTVAQGEPLTDDKFKSAGSGGYLAARLEAGMRALSIPIAPDSDVNGFVLPGDHVDVMLTTAVREGDQDVYTNSVAAGNVVVIAIDDKVESAEGTRTMPGRLATLLLTATEAADISVARRLGSLSLVLRGGSDDSGNPSDRRCHPERGTRQEIVVFRFGKRSAQVVNVHC